MRTASDVPPPWSPRRVAVGDWTVTALSDGFMRLDGGGMWGVVPKAMWNRMTPAAEDNTILLALRPFLLERGAEKVLIEPGIGNRWDPKWRRIYHIQPTATLEGTLREAGVQPGEITHVIASHCHWDHIGGALVERDDETVPLFPEARHLAPAAEIHMAKHADHARKGSYRAEDVAPLEDLGLLEGFEGTAELLPGIRAHVLGGHSDGVAVITVGEDEPGDTAIFWADVVPTTHHIQPPYIMAFDIDVVRSFEQRSEWLARAAEERWIGLFYHDVDQAFGRLRREDERYVFESVD